MESPNEPIVYVSIDRDKALAMANAKERRLQI